MNAENKMKLERVLMDIIDEAEDYEIAEEYEKAAESYIEAGALANLIKENPEQVYLSVLECYKKAEKSKEAIRYFDRLKQDFDPAYIFNVDILISASEAYCDDGQWELAEHTLYMAIDANHGEISDAMLPIQDRIRYYYHKTER